MIFPVPKSVIVLFNEFFQICLLRKRPQDLPASPELFWLLLIGYALISAILSYPGQSFSSAVLTGLVEAVLLLLITWVFLYLRSAPERLMQTCSALAGTGIIFSLFAFPLFYWGIFFASSTAGETLIGLLVLTLVLWNIAVMTHILSNALSATYILGALGAITYIALISLVLQFVIQAQGVV